MSDVLAGPRDSSTDFRGLVACGGFSYGDVLGAGEGWAKSILYHAGARDAVPALLRAQRHFTLGVCNGCQMFAALKEIVPGRGEPGRASCATAASSSKGASRWWSCSPRRRFSSPAWMARCCRSPLRTAKAARSSPATTLRGRSRRAAWCRRATSKATGTSPTSYPANPNGSPFGIAAITNEDGRVTLTMPHPERSFRYAQNSWRPDGAGEYSAAGIACSRNARRWVG